jgi:hypothetical protein
MTTVPTLTASEGESLRDSIACEIAEILLNEEQMSWNDIADRLLAGPLADLIAAQDQRDVFEVKLDGSEARVRILHEHLDWWRSKGKTAEANLIALAKMYGEACSELHQAWADEDRAFWRKEEAVHELSRRVYAAEAERDSLRSRLMEAEQAAEAMRERCAQLVETTQEWSSLTQNKRGVSDRVPGNMIGLAYADAIRALPPAPLPNPTSEDDGGHQ